MCSLILNRTFSLFSTAITASLKTIDPFTQSFSTNKTKINLYIKSLTTNEFPFYRTLRLITKGFSIITYKSILTTFKATKTSTNLMRKSRTFSTKFGIYMWSSFIPRNGRNIVFTIISFATFLSFLLLSFQSIKVESCTLKWTIWSTFMIYKIFKSSAR